jgi:hypothetical protein
LLVLKHPWLLMLALLLLPMAGAALKTHAQVPHWRLLQLCTVLLLLAVRMVGGPTMHLLVVAWALHMLLLLPPLLLAPLLLPLLLLLLPLLQLWPVPLVLQARAEVVAGR